MDVAHGEIVEAELGRLIEKRSTRKPDPDDVGSIDSRLRCLEGVSLGYRCPECHLAPDERRPMAVINEKYPEKGFDGDPDEQCPRCGRRLWCVIEVVYEDAEGGRGIGYGTL